MDDRSIPRTAVLATLGSAYLIWLALAALLSLGSAASGGGRLFPVLLTVAAATAAVILFRAALHLCRSAQEARVGKRLCPVPLAARARRAPR